MLKWEFFDPKKNVFAKVGKLFGHKIILTKYMKDYSANGSEKQRLGFLGNSHGFKIKKHIAHNVLGQLKIFP